LGLGKAASRFANYHRLYSTHIIVLAHQQTDWFKQIKKNADVQNIGLRDVKKSFYNSPKVADGLTL
jgi:hypothetical protein